MTLILCVVGNLNDFNRDCLISYEQMLPTDQYMLNNLNNLLETVKESYDDMNLNKALITIESFFLTQLSSFYIKSVRDRLYCEKNTSFERRSCQTALYYILIKSLVMLGPITPHLAEEAFYYSILKENNESLFRSDFNYDLNPSWNNKQIDDLFIVINQVREHFFELVQADKVSIFNVELQCNEDLFNLLNSTKSNEWIEELFFCSQLNITLNDSFKKTIILNNKQFKYSLKVDKIDDNRNYLCSFVKKQGMGRPHER